MNVPQTMPIFDDETRSAVDAVLRSGWITEGAQCEAFTAELLAYMQAPYGCLVSNGTMALLLALWAVGIGPGHHVAVPDLTFAATGNAIVETGATPALLDACDPHGAYHAGVPVWLFGNRPTTGAPALGCVADVAQAIGCWDQEHNHAGTWADVGCFSFYADKTITTGEGGFVVTRDKDVYDRLEMLRNHGRPKGARGYGHEAFGVNARMTDLQAAIGRVQLRHIEEYRVKRLDHWHHYATELAGLADVTIASVDDGCIPFRAVISVPDPVALAAYLEEREIQTRRMFLPLHRQPYLSRYARPGQTFPCADFAYEHGLLLSVHQNLTEQQVSWVCDSVKAFYR